MSCKHLKEFNSFQMHIMITEAKEAKKDVNTIYEGWINANSQTIREVFCETICPDKGVCKEKKAKKVS